MRAVGALALLAALTVVSYRGLWSASYVYEDNGGPTEIPTSWGTIWGPVLTSVRTAPLLSRRTVEPAIRDSAVLVAGPSPRAAHLGSLALHLTVGVLWYLLLVRVLRVPEWTAVLAVAIVWLHPLQVETVAYAAEWPELLQAIGCLLCLLGTLAGRMTVRRTLLVGLGLVLALGSKETGAAVPIVVVGLTLLVRPWREARTWWPLALAGAGAVAVNLPRLATVATGYPAQGALQGHLGMASIQAAALWRYLALVVWPVGFTVDHNWEVTLGPLALLALVGCVAVLGLAWRVRHTWPSVTFATVWTALLLAPRFVAIHPEFLTEHHCYGPMLAWSLVGADALLRLTAWHPSSLVFEGA